MHECRGCTLQRARVDNSERARDSSYLLLPPVGPRRSAIVLSMRSKERSTPTAFVYRSKEAKIRKSSFRVMTSAYVWPYLGLANTIQLHLKWSWAAGPVDLESTPETSCLMSTEHKGRVPRLYQSGPEDLTRQPRTT